MTRTALCEFLGMTIMIWFLGAVALVFGLFGRGFFPSSFSRCLSGTGGYAMLAMGVIAAYALGQGMGHSAGSAKAEMPIEIPVKMAVLKVTDGDSIRARLPSGKEVRLRLHGIDAPEMRQRCEDASGQPYLCGHTAQARMARLAPSGSVLICAHLDTDRYKRLVVRCERNGQDIAETLVREGLALAYRRYDDAYIPAEDAARQQKRGLWAGTFLAPWDWRRAN